MKKLLFTIIPMTVAVVTSAVHAIDKIPAPNTDVECFTEDEILVQLGDRTFLMPWQDGVFKRKERIPTDVTYTYSSCRYKREKTVPVTEMRVNNANEYNDERKELLPYKYVMNTKERKKRIDAEIPIMPRMSSKFILLNELYKGETIEDLMQQYIQSNLRGYNRKKDRIKTVTGDRKLSLEKYVNDPRRVVVAKRWESEGFGLESLSKKQGFYELEILDPTYNVYFGYLPNTKIPLRLNCRPEGVCGCSTFLDGNIKFGASSSGGDPHRFKYINDLNAYAEECAMMINEFLVMEQYAQKKINKEQNEVNK